MLEEVSKYGEVCDIQMIPNKSYCFLKLSSLEDSRKVYENINGIAGLGQNGSPLILSYVTSIPKVNNLWDHKLPAGLVLIEDFVDDKLEEILIKSVKLDASDSSQLKHRQVKHFGFEFLYGLNTVDPNKPLDEKIPNECHVLWEILKQKNNFFSHFVPDQLTVNKYEAGQGIPSHCDTHSPFQDPIISLSLGSDIVMEFKKDQKCVNVLLKKKSLLIMSGESRYGWQHGITPRSMDIVPVNGSLSVRKRSVRCSFTFRK